MYSTLVIQDIRFNDALNRIDQNKQLLYICISKKDNGYTCFSPPIIPTAPNIFIHVYEDKVVLYRKTHSFGMLTEFIHDNLDNKDNSTIIIPPYVVDFNDWGLTTLPKNNNGEYVIENKLFNSRYTNYR